MKFFFTVTKRGLAIALALIIIAFLAVARAASIKASAIDGSTHEKRMLYISSLKLSVQEENATSKQTVIPAEFSAVYEEYNKLQKSAGFDLSGYRGKEVTVYTYPLFGEQKNLTLIVYSGNIIGGDICDISVNGNMKALRKENV